MISNTLPRILRALSAGRFKEGVERFSPNIEEAIDPKGSNDVSDIVPETFHMTLPRTMRFEVVLRALKRVCHRHNAKLWLTDIRKAGINMPPRARMLIKGFRRTAFEALLLVEGDFVSFTSLP